MNRQIQEGRGLKAFILKHRSFMLKKMMGFTLDSITLGASTLVLVFALAAYMDPTATEYFIPMMLGCFGLSLISGGAKIALYTKGFVA